MEKRTFAAVARDIKKKWKNINFAAIPYLEALLALETTDKNAKYYLDNAEDIVLRFLCNASTFRGAKAKELKTELKSLIDLA